MPTQDDGGSCDDGNVDPRHNEGANIVFADGHAKWNSENEMHRTVTVYRHNTTPK